MRGLRVPRLSIRDCTGRPNNYVPRRSKMSAIDVIAKTICERLVLDPGPCQRVPVVTMFGRASSGGALAPELPHATCNQPESIRIFGETPFSSGLILL